MAIALHRRMGWTLVAARAADGSLPHVGVQCPDGTVVDVRGPIDEAAFQGNCPAVVPVDEARLMAAGAVHMEECVADADRLLHCLFPEIPPSGRDAKVTEAYGDEVGFAAARLALGGWTFDRRVLPAAAESI